MHVKTRHGSSNHSTQVTSEVQISRIDKVYFDYNIGICMHPCSEPTTANENTEVI
jgi:hypothetical protein